MKDSFEIKLKRLREIVTTLERGDLPLEDSVALYKEGLTLSQGCNESLEHARNEVTIVSDGLTKEFESLAATGDDDDS